MTAERSLVLFGAGGEPASSSTTNFDNTLNSLDDYLQKNKWKTIINFNGGHSTTEAIRTMKFSDAINKADFTPNNYNSVIETYINKIKNNKMNRGDQLMIMIDTHGAIQTSGEKTHLIAAGVTQDKKDLNKLTGMSLINLDSLKELTTLANDAGVKLAILDFSCHSGSSLSLANENTCVISSTGPNHFGYTNFGENFINKMKPGKSLEDVFLETRKKTIENAFPMISTPEGLSINKDIYQNITPYLYNYDFDPNKDKMSDYLLSMSTNEAFCARQFQYDLLQKQFDKLKAINALNMSTYAPQINRIKKLIENYKALQDRYINFLRNMGSSELNRKESFKADSIYPGNYTWKELIEADFDSLINTYKEYVAFSTKKMAKDKYTAAVEMYTSARKKKQEILTRYPNLKNYQDIFKKELSSINDTVKIARDIALEERDLYENLYNNARDTKKGKNSPCKDFVL
jgi:hypothetical protein